MKNDKIRLYSYVDWIIPAVFIISVVECYLGIWRLATLIKFFAITISLLLLSKGCLKCNNNAFMAFFIISLISPIAYLYNGRPFECLSSDLMNTLPSMLFFLIGLNDERDTRHFYDLMMYIGAGVLMFGVFCYVTAPGWYTNSLTEALNSNRFSMFEYNEELLLDTLRFSSFFDDSYPISLLSIYILSISLFNYFRKDNKLKYSLICAFIAFVAAVVCMHRVSIVSALLIVIGFMGDECIKGNGYQISKILFVIVVSILFVSLISESIRERLFSLLEMLTTRTENMSFLSAYNERQEHSNKLMSQWRFPILGHGLGSGGPTSRFLGYGGVTDAAYTKLLFENGLIGMMFFIILILSSIIRALKYFKYYIVELSIICFVCLAMTGSNTLTIAYLYIIPFWYMMGRIWNKQYLKYAKENNIKI